MKNILILSMLTIFLFACKDEGAEGPLEEEVIEKIFYHAFSDGGGDYCDSLILKDDSTSVIFRRSMDCLSEPFYISTFNNSDFKSFVDTMLVAKTSIILENDFKSIINFIDLNKFFEIGDSVSFRSVLGQTRWEIELQTNKRTKRISIYVKHQDPNYFAEELVNRLESFRNYHRLRVINIQGKEKW